jgi:TPR repeat protein
MRRSVWLSACLALVAGCHHDDSAPSGTKEQPWTAPSPITIAMQLRGCDLDAEACESECEAGVAVRCRALAMSLSQGRTGERDATKATALYERGCDLRDAPSCVFAGQMHEYQHGVPEDFPAAVRFYTRACDQNWSAGCYNLAIMLDRGRGVARDPLRAASLFEGACKAGAKMACDRAAALRAEMADAAVPPGAHD